MKLQLPKKFRKTLFLSLLGGTSALGQTYTLSQGEIPSDLTYSHRLQRMERHEDAGFLASSKEDAKVNFDRFNEFVLNELLLSGDVLFGDEMTQYMNDIANKLISNNEELKENIIVYTLKSEVPNAFMTADGHLFVTTGLLAQVQNETQLAFIIAHEMGHFVNHDVDREFDFDYDQSINSENFRKRDDISNAYKYSKQLEEDADQFASNLLIESNLYNPENAMEIFDILLYSYLPFDEINLSPQLLVPGRTTIPEEFIAKEINPITAVDDYDDSESTHPNIKARREAYIEALIDKEYDNSLVESPLGVERFHQVQDMARKDVLRTNLIEQQYDRAIYNALLMTYKDTVRNEEIQSVIGYSLHAIATYKIAGDYDDASSDIEDVEGESYRISYFLNELPKLEATALSVAYNYDLHVTFPESNFISNNYHKSLDALVSYFDKSFKELTVITDSVHHVDTLSTEEFEALSKLDKIRYKRELEGNSNISWISSLLSDYKNDSALQADFAIAEENKEDLEGEFNRLSSEFIITRYDIQRILNREYALGIKEAIVFAPSYIRLIEKEENPLDVETTYSERREISDLYEKVMRSVHLKSHYISPIEFDADDSEVYNDYSLLKTWVAERMNHTNSSVNHSLHEEVSALVEKYGTPYLVMPMIIDIQKKDISGKILLASLYSPIIIPVTLPWAVYESVTTRYKQVFATFVFDLQENKILMVDIEKFGGSLADDYATMKIYDGLFQITNKK